MKSAKSVVDLSSWSFCWNGDFVDGLFGTQTED